MIALGESVVVSLLVLLRHPLLCAELLFLGAVLTSSFGRSLGVPLMFWSEKKAIQFVAGLSCNLLAAQILFTAYLADTPNRIAPSRFIGITAGGWAVVVLLGVFLQARARAHGASSMTSEGTPPGGGSAPSPAKHRRSRTPGIRAMNGSAVLGSMTASTPAPWFFFFGALVGGALAIAVAASGLWLVHTLGWPKHWVESTARRLEFLSGTGDVADAELHVIAALVTALVLLAFFAIRRIATPALGICIVLALAAEIDGAVAFWLHSPGLGVLVALGLLFWAGGQIYKVRLGDVAALYADSAHPRPPYPPDVILGPGTSSLRADRLAEPALGSSPGRTLRIAGYDAGSKRPLVVVCTSGGGIRAAAWTAAILGQLDEDPEFRARTWMITGASGGMVGAAAWTATAIAEKRVAWTELMKAVGADSLSPVVQRLVFADAPGTLLPLVDTDDRGTALQKRWCANLASRFEGVRLDCPLVELRPAENSGEIPSLVFSPMVVEDGRRLLISNLELAWTVANRVNWLEAEGSVVPDIASVTENHARDVLGSDFAELSLATAARLSASFPYVSPAVQLPTEPARRVVDAGYYDNYGVGLACSWLERCFEYNQTWIENHVSGILIIQVRDGESALSPVPDHSTEIAGAHPESAGWRPVPPAAAPPTGRLARALQGLTSPPQAVLAARQSVTLFRNDAQLHTLRTLYAAKFGSAFVATTIFELKADVSLSWVLSDTELELIRGQAVSDGIAGKIRNVKTWMAKRSR